MALVTAIEDFVADYDFDDEPGVNFNEIDQEDDTEVSWNDIPKAWY